jgi:hypothetical protein
MRCIRAADISQCRFIQSGNRIAADGEAGGKRADGGSSNLAKIDKPRHRDSFLYLRARYIVSIDIGYKT